MKTKSFAVLALTLFSTFNFQLSTCCAQGTAFTYQGRLDSSGSPANGSYDIAFTLYLTNATGTALAGPVTNTAVAVTNGLFTTLVDFGPGVFTGTSNWLAIAVSTNGANSFSTLTPRQPLTPVPYAITAENVSGQISPAQLPAGLVTNNETGLNLNGTFSGNGASVTNVNATALNGLTATNFWQTGGNTVAAGQFLGSLNNQPVDFYANTNRALRLQYAADGANPAPNVIGGSAGNSIGNNGYGDFIGGGGNASYPNAIGPNVYYAAILGGEGNTVNGSYSIAGGGNNTISGGQAVGLGYNNSVTGSGDIALGSGNEAGNYGQAQNAIAIGTANHADGGNSVAMGNYNTASGLTSVAMGQHNTASGNYATAIGYNTIASGPDSAALGTYANAANDGTFVWADDTAGYFTSTANNQFLIRATGGVGINTNNPAGNALHVSGNVLVDNATTFTVNASEIIGGISNSIAGGGTYSVIGGGSLNAIQNNASASVIVGGGLNTIQPNAFDSVLVGGAANTIQTNAFYSFLGGGYNNSIQTNSSFSILVGGVGNSIQPNSSVSFLGGGQNNFIQANAANSTIVGGYNNSVSGIGSFIGGGGNDGTTVGGNTNAGNAAVIGGGVDNYIAGANFSVIGGGYLNTIQTLSGYSIIGGGYINTIWTNSYQSFIGGGGQNTILTNAFASMIGGGQGNVIEQNAAYSVIGGGTGNHIEPYAAYSVIGGGDGNSVSGICSVIPGGANNWAAGNYSFAAGNGATAGYDGCFCKRRLKSAAGGARKVPHLPSKGNWIFRSPSSC